MRRWLCCTCQVEESYPPYESERLRSPGNYGDGYPKGSKVAAPVKAELQKEAPPIEVPALSLEELKEKTDNFGSKALIGEGSYGRVYYASLENGKAVAVKKLDVASEPETNFEFLTQVSMVSRLKNENVVELLGYCVEGNLRVLAYEFATMGSLHDILHGRKGVQGAQPGPVLDWIQRVKIAVDAARGLEYLHEKLQPAIIHRDIRSSNVLLFEDFKAKIAVDALKTCTCLLKECRLELAKCIANPSCAANVACLQTCNNRPDETECQIKCGDLFENSVVDEFNECAVSRKKCVPRKSDVGEFPVPDPAVLVENFNMADFSGKWFITSGLNPTFDTFDCQLHEFHTESNKLVGNLSWRIKTPDTGFFTRSAVQRFVQDPVHPGILYNHDNEYLHYQDDWYILSSKIENKQDDYVFVYYQGRNDAWDGYGGAVVYTRSAVLPESIVPELEKAAKSVGRDFSKFIRTDNTCGPEPPLVERLEKTVEEGEKTIIKEVEEIEEKVEKAGKTELSLFQRLTEGFKEIQKDEENFLRELSKEETDLLNDLRMEAGEVEKLFGRALPIRKLR